MCIKDFNLTNKWYNREILFPAKKANSKNHNKLLCCHKVCRCFVLTDLYGDTFSSENWTIKWNGGSSSWSNRTSPISVWRWKEVNKIRKNNIFGQREITVFESYILCNYCFFFTLIEIVDFKVLPWNTFLINSMTKNA